MTVQLISDGFAEEILRFVGELTFNFSEIACTEFSASVGFRVSISPIYVSVLPPQGPRKDNGGFDNIAFEGDTGVVSKNAVRNNFKRILTEGESERRVRLSTVENNLE